MLNDPANNYDQFGLWYIDLNFSIGFWAGGTWGIMIGSEGVYIYGGGGVVSPPGGVALTWSPSDPTPGWNTGIQAGFGVGGQVGAAWGPCGEDFSNFGEGAETFWEVGLVTPGFSITNYYVYEVFEWPW